MQETPTASLYFLRSGFSNQPVEIAEDRVLTQISALILHFSANEIRCLTGLASLLATSPRIECTNYGVPQEVQMQLQRLLMDHIYSDRLLTSFLIERINEIGNESIHL
ncbi:hypothetical protein WUBG_01847 [Wuchereria bancrofti]|uniref:Uncharacterized protein n=1 Tax=Wuchereria bancrofti TaxID=6293 RepID=J9BIL7_WUCBA|nr:hypothetical protein WUBG_01847 [Wuchereria bancrofti]